MSAESIGITLFFNNDSTFTPFNTGDYTYVKSDIFSELFKLHAGFGVTFYKDPNFHGPSRSFYAINTAIDQSFTDMVFDNSSITIPNNIRSMKVFKLPLKPYCTQPSISDRDLCRAIYGENIIISNATTPEVTSTPEVTPTRQTQKNESNYVPYDVNMTPEQAEAWLQQNRGGTSTLYLIIGFLLLVVAIVAALGIRAYINNHTINNHTINNPTINNPPRV